MEYKPQKKKKENTMRIKQIEVYQYKELSEKAQEKAKNWYYEVDDMNFEWDNLKDDALRIGLKLTSVDEREGATGEFVLDVSQVFALIMSEHGETCETFKTAQRYKAEYAKLTEDQIINSEDEDLREEFLQSLLEDYRIIWQKTIEYHYSDEYITETMEANEYEFDVNGKRI